MRVLVASDRIGSLDSRLAGETIASGWPGAEIRVVPVGDAGAGFVPAYAAAFGGRVESWAAPGGVATGTVTPHGSALGWESSDPAAAGIPAGASSRPLGDALRAMLERRPARIHLDLTGSVVHDGGAGLLAALGARGDAALDAGAEPLAGLTAIDLAPVRERIGGTELVGVVPAADRDARLLGLRGITSRLGREHDEDPARMLAVDAALEQYARLAGPDVADAPGAGACGGLGFAVLALGGRLATGPSVTLDTVGADGRFDLVVTGCDVFDFARRGGGVVAEAAGLAGRMLAPCVLLAGEVYVGAREMRTMGIEAAYPVASRGNVSAGELAALSVRVGRNWRW